MYKNGWTPNPLCEEPGCPEPIVENARILRKSERPYKPGERIEYQCLPGYEPERFTVTCGWDGRWQSMRYCTVQRVGCGPPPLISHAVQDVKEQYKDGEKSTYDCPMYYVQDGDPHMICMQGNWTGKGRCLKPCTVDVHVMDVNKIELKFGGRTKIYLKHLDHISFVCVRGYKHTGEVGLRQSCNEGVIPLPVCRKSEDQLLLSKQEISCTPPKIAHGTITDGKMEYSENELLKYVCNEGYRPRRGAPKCLKTGWSITPECEEMTCLLGSITYGIKSISPRGKSVFRIGESVEITCSETYRLFSTKLNSRNILCLDSGEWEIPPVCEEITCDFPVDEHVQYPHYYFRWGRKLGDRKSYWCESGYKRKAHSATCTENGWSPKPLCEAVEEKDKQNKPTEAAHTSESSAGRDQAEVKRVGCGRPPLIPHAVQDFKKQYEEDEIATYDCPSYYVQDGDPHMVCKQGRWTGNGRCLKPCTVDVHVMDANNIEIKVGGRRKIYSQHNDFITFVCARGYRHTGAVELRQRCTDGVVQLPTCV
ncbi:complement factor H-related protein 1-like [Hoplias malabaricus]|uniref:complement factor H-related protein 1-like n=1 Tax=Hoplias malabaricus TaxID=27720 RepID=UPI0034627884